MADVQADPVLAEMRRKYEYATLETHMLIGGEMFLRCRRCKIRPVPRGWQHVCWCDACLEAATR